MDAGRKVAVAYAVPGALLWHVRLILAVVRTRPYTFYIATPDEDVYDEEYSPANGDLQDYRLLPVAGGLPFGVNPARVYDRAVPFTAQQISDMSEHACGIANADEAADILGGAPDPGPRVNPLHIPPGGAPPGLPPPAPPGPAPLPAPPGPPPGGPAGAPAGPAPAPARPPGKWLCCESAHGLTYGDEVVPPVGFVDPEGVRAVIEVAGGQSICCHYIATPETQDFLALACAHDARVLPIRTTPGGDRFRGIIEYANSVKEEPITSGLPGPRSANWCIQFLKRANHTPEQHHEFLVRLCKLEPNAWGVQDHFNICQALKHAMEVDQVDMCNLVFGEVLFRRLQTIEYTYSIKLRAQEQKQSQTRKLSFEEQALFGGVVRSWSQLMICPELLDYVKAEAEREAKLAKNMRQAREEREALAK